MWQTVIVVVIVAAAALWYGLRLWRTLSGKAPACCCGDAAGQGGGCDCGSCPSTPEQTPASRPCPHCGPGH